MLPLQYDTTELRVVRGALSREATYIPTFVEYRDRVHPPVARAYYTRGVDGRSSVAASTARARANRHGYYGQVSPMPGSGARSPYGRWSGNLMLHTTKERGRVRVRVGVLTFQYNLQRGWLRNPWDLVGVEAGLARVVNRRFERALSGVRFVRTAA